MTRVMRLRSRLSSLVINFILVVAVVVTYTWMFTYTA